ncbi:hypothetical protein YC2023_088589 [Brassica napus]
MSSSNGPRIWVGGACMKNGVREWQIRACGSRRTLSKSAKKAYKMKTLKTQPKSACQELGINITKFNGTLSNTRYRLILSDFSLNPTIPPRPTETGEKGPGSQTETMLNLLWPGLELLMADTLAERIASGMNLHNHSQLIDPSKMSSSDVVAQSAFDVLRLGRSPHCSIKLYSGLKPQSTSMFLFLLNLFESFCLQIEYGYSLTIEVIYLMLLQLFVGIVFRLFDKWASEFEYELNPGKASWSRVKMMPTGTPTETERKALGNSLP